MSGESVAARKKRVSKKNKKSWRKHTDTKDVDSFLDDQRLEERLGKPFADRRDDELFEIDHEGYKEELVSIKRLKKQLKSIKCFSILENQSAVPDPIVKRNRVRTAEERKHPLVKKIEEDRKKKGILKKKKIASITDQILAREKKLKKSESEELKFDLWEMESDNKLGTDTTWLTPTTLYHTLKNTGKLKKKIPEKFLAKPYSTPAMEAPHPGISYNPSYSDHQELLSEVANKELETQKEEKHLNRVTSKMFTFVSLKESENIWMDEMSQGLPKQNTQERDQENKSDSEYTSLSVNPPVKIKKKTLKTRRKLKEAKMAALQHKQHKTEKKKVSDIYKLKFLNQDIEKTTAKLERLREKRKKVKAAKAEGTKQLSKVKFQPLELEFNLGQEISGNLRGITPQGNIIKDRFKSLQKRNVIEPTTKHVSKKAKVKRYEKKSHKMGWEPKGY